MFQVIEEKVEEATVGGSNEEECPWSKEAEEGLTDEEGLTLEEASAR